MRIIAILWCALSCMAMGCSEAAKILAIFPSPGPSQYIVVQPFLRELAGRGHEVSVISAFPQKTPIRNLHDITIKNILADFDSNMLEFFDHETSKWQELNLSDEFIGQICVGVLEAPSVRQLLADPNEHFDLIIVETMGMDVLYTFGDHFRAPVIGVSSYGSDRHCDSLMGNPSPLSYVPLVTSSLTDRMTFTERLQNVYHTTLVWLHERLVHRPRQQALWRQYMPHAAGDFFEKSHNVSLLLLNQHYALSFARPYVPTMIPVAGFHVQHKPTPLPPDIAHFIAAHPEGVVYFSLGSNIKSTHLTPRTRATLMEFFAALPLGVLWKFESDVLPGQPPNVLIRKWFPQPDVLAHPQVRAFLTHGGLLSTIEALHHAKPLVAMPIFYDQHLNARRAQRLGFGEIIDYRAITGDTLRRAFDRVLHEPTYREKAAALSRVFRDHQHTPLETAVYWTEYVLRHRGTPYMRVAGADMHFMPYHSIDTFLVFFGGIAGALAVAVWLTGRLVAIGWRLVAGGGVRTKAPMTAKKSE